MGQLSNIRLLNPLARLYGVQTAYYDTHHQRRPASADSLLAVLRSLGAPLNTLTDVPGAWRERKLALWRRLVEPVTVAWDGRPVVIPVRLPADMAEAAITCRVRLETGENQDHTWAGADLETVEAAEVDGIKYTVKQLSLPAGLPWGYHRLTLELPGRLEESLLISAPLRAYTPQEEPEKRSWGAFLPLYALHTAGSWGAGDFSDLEALIDWVGGKGGDVVATLPLLAAYSEGHYEASPYLPASRLLWNEFYLDVNRVPYLEETPSAQALLSSSALQNEIKELRQLPLVDYPRQMALKTRVLQELSRHFFALESGHLEDLRHFAGTNPTVEDYARFRAAGEKQGASWRSWPQPLRDGILKDGDYDEERFRYHLYVQWLAHRQMESVSARAGEKNVRLYLDLPLGVHPDGYDVWREQAAFLPDVAAGAPPDAVFTTGQDWTFPPLHPEKIREQGYRYTIAYLRHHLKHAGVLRIDHVMGCHRLFCIPKGMTAGGGVYVHYRAGELYAILTLESQRHRAMIVGEDLGMVPRYVRADMKKHHLQRMYVLHYELATGTRKGPRPASPDSVASLNTHDMPPFASFYLGTDIAQWMGLGLLKKGEAHDKEAGRRAAVSGLNSFLKQKGWLREPGNNPFSALQACLSFLAAGKARIVLVNLEDLWLEKQPQNIPGTREEYPDWRRRARYWLEEFGRMPQVVDTLNTINLGRKQGGH